jgi:hypothetical protein
MTARPIPSLRITLAGAGAFGRVHGLRGWGLGHHRLVVSKER